MWLTQTTTLMLKECYVSFMWLKISFFANFIYFDIKLYIIISDYNRVHRHINFEHANIVDIGQT